MLKRRRGWGLSSPARSNREQVIRAYLHMLQHAAAVGVHRQHHQTPYEYAPKLHHALPHAEDDINGLTAVFVHVRYSPKLVAPDQAAKAVAHGQGLQRALRQLRHGNGSE